MLRVSDGLGMAPRVDEPESALIPGMAAEAPRGMRAAPSPHDAITPTKMPDTSQPGAVALQSPGAWIYDFDPATGASRATFNGVVNFTTWGGATGGYLPIAGGTITGSLTVAGTLTQQGAASFASGAVINGGGTIASGGLAFGSQLATSNTDFSKHILLYSGATPAGVNVQGSGGAELAITASNIVFNTGNSQTQVLTLGSASIGFSLPISLPDAGILGVSDGSAAPAYSVGELLNPAVSGQAALSTGTPAIVQSLAVSAGDWDISGTCENVGTATVCSSFAACVNLNGSMLGGGQSGLAQLNLGSGAIGMGTCLTPGPRPISLSVGGTVYLVAQATFSSGTFSAYGTLIARRRR